jgi:hypothetical protein
VTENRSSYSERNVQRASDIVDERTDWFPRMMMD